MRRIKIVFFAPHIVVNWMKQGSQPCFFVFENGLPDDSRIYGCGYDEKRAAFYLLIESATFDAVKEGDLVPVHENPVIVDLSSQHRQGAGTLHSDRHLSPSLSPTLSRGGEGEHMSFPGWPS